mgnify:CR=1 FL=1
MQIIFQRGDESLLYFPRFFEERWMNEILDEVEFVQNKIKLFGKEHLEPRLTAWFGPPYKYSNIQWTDKLIPPKLSALQSRLAELHTPPHVQLANYLFNSVLCNYYRDGSDSMGWHSDDEPEMDTTFIASVSFGAERIIKFRNKNSKEKLELKLESGSLLLMKNFQANWQHSVPKSKRVSTPRLNLTFRRILQRPN